MQSFLYVACLLAAYATATPYAVPRYGVPLMPTCGSCSGGYPGVPYPSGGGFAYQSQQQREQRASESSSLSYGGGFPGPGPIGGFGADAYGAGIGGGFTGADAYGAGLGGGFGVGGGIGGVSSSSSYSRSSSYSSSAVMNAFSGVNSHISSIQSMMASSSFTQSMAIEQMSQLAYSLRRAMSQTGACGSCFSGNSFTQSVSSVFQQMSYLMQAMQSRFGNGYGQCISPLASLQSSFQSFFQTASSQQVSYTSLMPAGFPSLVSPAIPNMVSMVGFK